MLAEFREQKKFIDELPNLRMTFERFVKGGNRNGSRRERTEVLQSQGIPFQLTVTSDSFSKSLLEGNLIIRVSSQDGREISEFLPSMTYLLKNHNVGEYTNLSRRLDELKSVVDKFLTPHIKPL